MGVQGETFVLSTISRATVSVLQFILVTGCAIRMKRKVKQNIETCRESGTKLPQKNCLEPNIIKYPQQDRMRVAC